MSEREIELLYEQRRSLREGKEGADRQAGYVDPEDSQGGRPVGMSTLRLLIHPLGAISIAGSPRIGEPLTQAVVAARSVVEALLAETPKSFEWLTEWSPQSTIGWKAGHASDELADYGEQVFVAATYSYTGQLSLRVSMGLEVGPPRHGGRLREAFEHIWAAETVALLAIAGHFYREIPGVGFVRAALFLDGLDGTVASMPVHTGTAATVSDGSFTASSS